MCCSNALFCMVCRMTHSGADQDQEIRRRKVSMMSQVSGLAILRHYTDRHCGWQTDVVVHTDSGTLWQTDIVGGRLIC